MRHHAIFAALAFVQIHNSAVAQCTPAASAAPGLTLMGQPGGTENRSGLAFNPLLGLYYSVNAGNSSYPLDTYNEDGTLAATVASGFDYRGVWWEPTTSFLIGNGYSTMGIFNQALALGTGLPLGSGTVLFTGNQPDDQSIGDLDTDANEILYYNAGSIYRYNAATNVLISSHVIGALPVTPASINSNTVMYIGCPGRELALYDHVNRRVLYVSRSSWEYVGSTQLPLDAPQRASFGLSYANGSVWLYELGAWHGYDLGLSLGLVEPGRAPAMRMWPNPAADQVQLEWSGAQDRLVLAITDMAGREVMRHTFPGAAGTRHLEVSALTSGSYAVHALLGSVRRAWPLVIAR